MLSPFDQPINQSGAIPTASCDAEQVMRTMQLLAPADDCFALFAKAVRKRGLQRPVNEVGYFDRQNLDAACQTVIERSGHCEGVYITLNPLRRDLLARADNRMKSGTNGPEDAHVTRLSTLLIDVDVGEIGGVSSTDDEKSQAHEFVQQVRQFLNSRGFPAPVLADSGNSYHLVHRVDLPTEDATLVHDFLVAIGGLLNNGQCRIDPKVANAARYTKMYGSLVCKGDSIPERPHRLSRILELPDRWQEVPRDLLTAVVDEFGIPEENVCTADQSRPHPIADRIERARRYLEPVPPAISGDDGSDRELFAACRVGPLPPVVSARDSTCPRRKPWRC